MAEKREILRYHSRQLRIFVVAVWMISSKMRHSVAGKMSEKRSGAMEIRNVCCLLAVLSRAHLPWYEQSGGWIVNSSRAHQRPFPHRSKPSKSELETLNRVFPPDHLSFFLSRGSWTRVLKGDNAKLQKCNNRLVYSSLSGWEGVNIGELVNVLGVKK